MRNDYSGSNYKIEVKEPKWTFGNIDFHKEKRKKEMVFKAFGMKFPSNKCKWNQVLGNIVNMLGQEKYIIPLNKNFRTSLKENISASRSKLF